MYIMRGAIMVHTRYTALFIWILVRLWCKFGAENHGANVVQKKKAVRFGRLFLLFVDFIEPGGAVAVRDHIAGAALRVCRGADGLRGQHGDVAASGKG